MLGFESVARKSYIHFHEPACDLRILTLPIRTTYHPAGSAAMGKVVDSNLNVYGVRGLRVVDASVIPLPIAGHYQACVYVIAEQAADIIASRYALGEE